MDEKGTRNPTCPEMDNVWQSPKFCGKTTQISHPKKEKNKGDHTKKILHECFLLTKYISTTIH